MLAANGSFAYWTVSGMETGLFGMLITLGIFLYLKEQKESSTAIPLSSIVFLLASLTRPEGNIIFAVTVLHKAIVSLRAPKNGTGKGLAVLREKNNLIWLGMYIVPALIYMGWRYSYYGYLFPNTFYAKTGSSLDYFKTGTEYLWLFFKNYGGYGILGVISLLALRNKKRFNEYLYPVMVFYIFCLYIIFVGGDVLRPNRFFVPLMPVFFILVQEGLSQLADMFDKSKEAVTGAVIALLVICGLTFYTYKEEFEQIKQYSVLENGLVEKMKLIATWLKNQQTKTGRPLVVGATTIGAISYYSDVTLIDMLGLTDKEVAHNPQPIAEISSKDVGWRERNYNVEYVLSRKPDYILFSTNIKPSAYAERGLFTNDEFIRYYYPFVMTMKEYAFNEIIYKRKTDEEANMMVQLPKNPNYQKSFINLLTQAMNTQKDKSKLQEALDLYKKAIETGPSGWGLPYQMMGELYLQMKDNNTAAENFKKAIELDDHNILSQFYMYKLNMQSGDSAGAMQNLSKLQKYAPDMLNQ
jgi:tetratricopeptide (TPR) repeat protein